MGVPGTVGERLTGDSEDVLRQGRVRRAFQWPGETDGGGEAQLRRVLFDDFQELGVQAAGRGLGPVKPEDAGADLADDLVQGPGVAVDLLRGDQIAAADVTLESHAKGEQFLDDVIVQVGGDAVVVLDPGQDDLVGAGLDEFQGHGGVAGERGGHIQVDAGEFRPRGQPAQLQGAANPPACGQRYDDQRANIGAQHRAGCFAAVAGDKTGLAGADRLPGR